MSNELQLDADLEFQARNAGNFDEDGEFTEYVGTGFNEYGVRVNEDENGDIESVDVLYEAMQPGDPEDRNGVRITSEFLQRVANKDYSNTLPFIKDHSRFDSSSKIGDVQTVWYSTSRDKLMLMNRIPNTGAAAHDEAIARFTHDPPSWRNGSVGFGNNYTAVRNDDGEPELEDARLKEFSTTPFPGGYDDGGLAPAFAEQAQEAVSEFDDGAEEEAVDPDESGEADASENSAAVYTETITF